METEMYSQLQGSLVTHDEFGRIVEITAEPDKIREHEERKAMEFQKALASLNKNDNILKSLFETSKAYQDYEFDCASKTFDEEDGLYFCDGRFRLCGKQIELIINFGLRLEAKEVQSRW